MANDTEAKKTDADYAEELSQKYKVLDRFGLKNVILEACAHVRQEYQSLPADLYTALHRTEEMGFADSAIEMAYARGKLDGSQELRDAKIAAAREALIFFRDWLLSEIRTVKAEESFYLLLGDKHIDKVINDKYMANAGRFPSVKPNVCEEESH